MIKPKNHFKHLDLRVIFKHLGECKFQIFRAKCQLMNRGEGGIRGSAQRTDRLAV